MNTIDIHGKPYVMVKDRVIHFNNEYPNGCIRSKLVDRIDSVVIFEATVIPDVDKPERFFTGHAEEEIGSSQINQTSALENCETSAIGRALAMMGIGVNESFASGDEVANAVYQQGGETIKTRTEKVIVTQSPPETSENELICPDCGKGAIDNRDFGKDGVKLKLSKKGDANQPAFKCIDNTYPNPTCGFKSYNLDEKDAGVLILAEEEPPF